LGRSMAVGAVQPGAVPVPLTEDQQPSRLPCHATRAERKELAALDKANDQPGMRVGGRMWRAARTTCLLAVVGCAGIMLVDLPTALNAQTDRQVRAQPIVKASDKWITLGTERSDSSALARPTPTERPEGQQTRPRRRPNGIQLASLGRQEAAPIPQSETSGGNVLWNASSTCLNPTLRRVVSEVAASFGPVTVNSTCRSHSHNARVGGAKQSFHLSGSAADFRIAGNPGATLAFLKAHRSVGGLKHYGGGVFHIDTGPRRTW
jgi:Peptidase M15